MSVRFRLCPPRPDDPERVLGLYFLPAFLAFLGLVARLPARWMPPCLWHRRTGLPCPACGAWRALRLLSAGAAREAWLQQPLIVLLLGLAAAFMVYSWIAAVMRWRRPRVEGLPGGAGRWGAGLLLLLAALNWSYLLRAGR